MAERVNLYNEQRVILPIKINTCAIRSGPGTSSELPGLDNLYLFPRPLVGAIHRFPFYVLELYNLHFSPPSFLRSSFCLLNFLHPRSISCFLLLFTLFLFAYSSFYLALQLSFYTYFFFYFSACKLQKPLINS